MRLVAAAAVGVMLVSAAQARAETARHGVRPTTADEGTVVTLQKDGKVCRKKTEPGTRLGGHTDCRTKAEWDAMERSSREDTTLHQRTGLTINPH